MSRKAAPMNYEYIRETDPQIFRPMAFELQRQRDHIELIASENFTSESVMEAMGSHLTNKYAEGYPGHRYYGGCENVDMVERIAIDRAKRLYGAEYANVQPHAGSQANLAVYVALLDPGDTILGMSLDMGGHLTHGAKVSITGKFFDSHFYGVSPDTETIDYDEVLKVAKECRPKMIICGASAYPRFIDFKRFREIADEVGAYLMVDIAHIGGLVAAGVHPSPSPMPTWSPPPHIRRCAARAVPSSCARRSSARRSTRPSSPAPRVDRSCMSSQPRPSA